MGSAPGQIVFANSIVEVFIADPDPSGYGEGKTYLGRFTTGSTGNFNVDLTVSGLSKNDYITATATDPSNNTSEFSKTFLPTSTCTLLAEAESDKTINQGTSITIGGQPAASGGTPPYTYSWTPTTGLDNPAAANPTASPDTTTIYTLIVTDTQRCQSTDTITVTINPPLTCNVLAEAGSDKTIDYGRSTTIGGQPAASGGTPPYTYSWTANHWS